MSRIPNVTVSKKLTWLLRHGDPEKTGLSMRPDGFVDVDEILKQVGISFEKLCDIVKNDPKGRFRMISEHGKNLIRANQGHSLSIIDDDQLLNLVSIGDNSALLQRLIIHGTYLDKWGIIKESGLSRMSRSHIHFVPAKNFKLEPTRQDPKETLENASLDQIVREMSGSKCKAGIRPTSEVLILIDMASCIAKTSEYKFHISHNNVVLTRGNNRGLIDPEMFLLCIDIKNGEILLNNIRNEQMITEIVRVFINSMR